MGHVPRRGRWRARDRNAAGVSRPRALGLSAATLVTAATGLGLPAARAVAPGVRPLSWGPVRLAVPAAWPVVDLDRDPTRCLRLDVHAVYLGAPGPDPRCPARLIGRTETVQLARVPVRSGPAVVERELRAETGQIELRLPRLGVEVVASYGSDRAVAEQILRTVSERGWSPAAGQSAGPPPRRPAPASPVPGSPARAGPGRPAGRDVTPGVFTGAGFDTCAAPSLSTMTAWLASPYQSIGVYLGGANRACGDGNLSASWIRTVTGQGWRLLPIYVGYQAPCVVGLGSAARFSRDPRTAAGQGTSAATDALGRANAFGLPAGSPVYFDLEGYDAGDSGCRSAVLAFLAAWTQQLHRLGLRSGVYSGVTSGIGDLDRAVGSSVTVPDAVWIAHWDGVASVWDPHVDPAHWADHQRIKQYRGGHAETWGGVRVEIDNDRVDGPVVAAGSGAVDYGFATVGPGSPGFSTSGTWYAGAPYGLRGAMRWTWSSGSPATASATWAGVLSPGVYDVAAFIPGNYAGGTGRYAVTGGTSGTASIDQGAYSDAFVGLGRFRSTDQGRITVRLTNDGDPPRAHTVGADAVRFRWVAPLVPGAAWRAPADYTGDGRADLGLFRPSTGTWYVRGLQPFTLGAAGDVPVPGNYRGDRQAEPAVWRPSDGTWRVLGAAPVHWGERGDIPVVADFTGDGLVDPAIWRWTTGTWWIRGVGTVRWGAPGDVPVPADFSGDGRAEPAVWRPATGTWWVLGSPPRRWGEPGDVPGPATLSSRGRADLALWRPATGTWYVLGATPLRYGEPGDVPRPGDYTGGGLADHALWRPSTGVWYVKDEPATRWGIAGDVPL